jgi:hypothetical protein
MARSLPICFLIILCGILYNEAVYMQKERKIRVLHAIKTYEGIEL